ncbi:N-acetylmuramoyl-L-alanine amidase [Microvirga sp. W0021]|uniref:N-acetylmuramoyl-L-alanine amidase n=1 Tax=Hohaiivirga grylli TaxID=3133970 RepID=A0ABV0BK30_9HYPH
MSQHPKPDSPVATKVFPSPNHGERVGVSAPDLIILHYTGMPDAGEALQRLCNPVAEVSCHYFIFEDGRTLQLVPEARRAWHAGVSSWAGQKDINSRSIGIEIANPGHEGGLPPFPEAQIKAVIALCRDIAQRWQIKPQDILGHSDIAPGRKVDPGELFPWEQLHREGIGHWVPPVSMTTGPIYKRDDQGAPIEALQAMFAMYGYGIMINGVYDQQMEDVVAAFQRHFRQNQVDGIADTSTLATLRELINSRP